MTTHANLHIEYVNPFFAMLVKRLLKYWEFSHTVCLSIMCVMWSKLLEIQDTSVFPLPILPHLADYTCILRVWMDGQMLSRLTLRLICRKY